MNRLSIRQLLVFLLIVFSVGISVCDGQQLGTGPVGRTKHGLFGISFGKKRDNGVKAPKSVNQVKREQEKKKKKEEADYVKSVKESQKRTVKIQSPEVQDRMKQNKKDTKTREKTKKAKASESTKKAGKKYKK
jgi:hypothetical protein